MQTQPECYGGMFPDLSTVRFNTLLKGKVFDVLVNSSGFGLTDRSCSANVQEWAKCTGCPAYPDCYHLSIAKLLLHAVTQEFGMARAL